ncbi:uncharacterized protein [Ptychodera flava]|uniref:uncharacterized protein n=1 Tax=Ptychodera flava TaxID=63121 RepID=UPI00396A5B5F
MKGLPRANTVVRSAFIVFLLLFACLLSYSEYFEYMWQAGKWEFPTPPPGMSMAHPDNVKVLFVGDPQLQGNKNERYLVGSITRWDSDLYLQKTFELALHFLEPDIVVFLGDLLDEGSIATESEYLEYKNRFFKKIFVIPKHMNVKLLLLPGDNDIGGEGSDFITQDKTRRFELHFDKQYEVVPFKYVDFLKVDLVPWMRYGDVAKEDFFRERLDEELEEMVLTSDNKIRVLLSHPKLLSLKLSRTAELLTRLKPHYAFTAHLHHEGVITHNLERMARRLESEDNGAHPKSRVQGMMPETQEFSVPTCSYRMGEKKMAYGAAVIDTAGNINYTLLWLPSRYAQLYRYLLYGIVFVILMLMRVCCGKRRMSRHWSGFV